jgi:hypothetical protein
MGSGCIDPHFPDLGTNWRWMVNFTPRPLYPQERAPGIHWIGGRVNSGAGLDDVEKRNFLTLSGLEFRPLVVQPVASRYTDWAIPAPCVSATLTIKILRFSHSLYLRILYGSQEKIRTNISKLVSAVEMHSAFCEVETKIVNTI